MVVLTAYIKLLPDKLGPALAACREVRRHSVAESGCERYDFFLSPDDPNKIVFVEEWTSRADLDRHFQQTAFKEFSTAIGECCEKASEIRIFEAILEE